MSTVINTVKIDDGQFKELTKDLIENSVGGDNSPFMAMKDMLKEDLDKAVDLDATQKAGIYSSFLTSTFSDINKQAMSTALEILKTNASLSLDRYNVEATYNEKLQDTRNKAEQEKIYAKELMLKERELDLMEIKNVNEQVVGLKVKAELKKQYGVMESHEVSVGNGDDKYTPVIVGGVTHWYKTNDVGDLLANQEEVDRVNTANGNEDAVLGVYTTTDYTVAQRGTAVTTSIGSTVTDTMEPGAIDKQIIGYDKLNQKDMIKTLNEMASMFANAQVCAPQWLPNAVKSLILKVEPNTDMSGTRTTEEQAKCES